MSYKSHKQYEFLRKAGMTDIDIVKTIAYCAGVRSRTNRNISVEASLRSVRHKKLSQNQQAKQKMDILTFSTRFTSEDLQWAQSHLQMLLLLLNKVRDENGIIQVLSIGGWKTIFQQLKQKNDDFKSYSSKQLFDIYLKYLFEYQFYLSGRQLHIQKDVDLSKSISQAHFVKGGLKQIIKSSTKGVEMYNYQVVVFQKGFDQLGINYADIDLQKIQKECGEQIVEVRIQNPLDNGFKIRKFTNISHKMSIKQYCDYQRHVNDESYKQQHFGQMLKNGNIFFGVNFQPSNLQVFSELWKNLQGNFLGFRQPFDLLSYMDTDIPGCSSPQFYLKVKGCWTGGHQENINMCAVNINHGPDSSEWYTVPYEYVEKVRGVLKQRFKCDLYLDEGLWFERINWFIQNGYPIKRIIQKKGDIVISGPGTLHWVRSFGIALQSAWNVFPTNYNMIHAAFHRHYQNEAMNHDRAGIIPLKALLLKHLDHRLHQIDEKTLTLILVNIDIWKNKEERLRLKLSTNFDFDIDSIVVSKLGDLESVCLLCRQQIFMYYVKDWDGDGYACLSCLQKNIYKLENQKIQLYNKYEPEDLRTLLNEAHDREKYTNLPFNSKICTGNHIGKISCTVLNKQERKRCREDYNSQKSNYVSENVKVQSTLNKKFSNKAQKINKNDVIIQTDDISCVNCNSQLNFEKPARKIYKRNDQKEQQQANNEKQKSLTRDQKDDQLYHSRRDNHDRQRNNYRHLDDKSDYDNHNSRKKGNFIYKKQATYQNKNQYSSRDKSQKNDGNNQDNNWKKDYRNNQDSNYNSRKINYRSSDNNNQNLNNGKYKGTDSSRSYQKYNNRKSTRDEQKIKQIDQMDY